MYTLYYQFVLIILDFLINPDAFRNCISFWQFWLRYPTSDFLNSCLPEAFFWLPGFGIERFRNDDVEIQLQNNIDGDEKKSAVVNKHWEYCMKNQLQYKQISQDDSLKVLRQRSLMLSHRGYLRKSYSERNMKYMLHYST